MAIIDGIEVSTQVLTATATDVRSINKTLDDKLLEINKTMSALKGDWQSTAADDIRAKMDGMQPRFQEYKDVVESYCKFLETTAQSYESTEAAIKSNASQFK